MSSSLPIPISKDGWTLSRSIRTIGTPVYTIAILLVVALLVLGGRRQPQSPAGAVAEGGRWYFHAGDIPLGVDRDLGSKGWEAVDLISTPDSHDGDVGIPSVISGWRARGYPDLYGYAWYRRTVMVPTGRRLALVGPPMVDDGYELYWNAKKLGGVGRLDAAPWVGQSRPQLFAVPEGGGRSAQLEIRAFMQPGIDRDADGGGLRTLPILATAAAGAKIYRAQWRRTIAGYVVDAAESLAMAIMAILLIPGPGPREVYARWTALALLTTVCLRAANPLIAWSDAIDLRAYERIGALLPPIALMLWTFAWDRWPAGRGLRLLSPLALIAGLATIVGVGTAQPLLAMIGRAFAATLFVSVAMRSALNQEGRSLALFTLLAIAVANFADELTSLGLERVWFPFGIGVSRTQLAYAVAIPLIAATVTMPRKENLN